MGKIKQLYEAIGGRKAVFLFLLTVVSVVTTFFVAKEYYASMMQYLAIMYGAFCAGNGIEHLGGLRK